MTNFSAYIKMILRQILRMSFLKLITGRNLIALLIDDDKKKRAIIESARHLVQWLSIPRRSNRTEKMCVCWMSKQKIETVEGKKNNCANEFHRIKSVWLLFIDCCDRNMTMINTSAHFFHPIFRIVPRTFICLFTMYFTLMEQKQSASLSSHDRCFVSFFSFISMLLCTSLNISKVIKFNISINLWFFGLFLRRLNKYA